MHHIGIDIIEIGRIEKAIARWGDTFLYRVYTELEIKLYRKKTASLAARFAGKEAVIKALGKQSTAEIWKNIEIVSDSEGRPLVRLYGSAQNQAKSLGLENFTISLSHSRKHAIALVVGERR